MRMWNVNPIIMCDKHLLGEHVEMHMFVGTILKRKSLTGYLEGGLVQVDDIRQRHDELAAEMEFRGMNHKSQLPDFEYEGPNGVVNTEGSYCELARRCPKCAERIKGYFEIEFGKSLDTNV